MEPQPVALKKLLLRIGLRILLIVSAILLISLLLPPVLDLFLPFILAFITASILAPIVRKFTKTVGKVRKFWSMLFVILLILVVTGVLGYAVYYLFSQISDLIGSWSSIQVSVTSLLTDLEKFLENNLRLPSPDVEEYALNILQKSVTWLTDKISSWAPSVVVGVGTVASGIANFLISLLFFLVGTYFMTSDYPNLRKKLSTWVPDIIRPHVRHIKAAMGTAMFGYLKAQLILSGVVTLIIFFALLIWGQKYSILIAIFCGIIDLIPFFGSGTVLIPWAVVELFLGNYTKTVFLLFLAFVLFLFRKLAEPKVVGNQTGLSPLLSLMSIYVGMKLGGVLGMILAPILCMIVISLYRVGFFEPTLLDFKLLITRILSAARLPSDEESIEEDGHSE